MSGLRIDDPVTLAQALASARIIPGDTILLRGGTYPGEFVSALRGNALNHITIRPYANEPVEIDGSLFLQDAQYVDVFDLDIHWTGWTSRTAAAGGDPPLGINAPVHDCISMGTNCRAINCNLYDGRQGAIAFATGYTMYGCLLLNNGFLGGGSPYGHDLYSHNAGGQLDTLRHNVFAKAFNYGLHLYSGGYNAIQNYTVTENLFLSSKNCVGGDYGDTHNIVFDDNLGWTAKLDMGLYTTPNVDGLSMHRNRWYGAWEFKVWQTAEVSDNTLVYEDGREVYVVRVKMPDEWTPYTWDRNAYYAAEGEILRYNTPPDYANQDFTTLAAWQAATGFDANGALSAATPDDSQHVFANEYAAVSKRKALVSVFNWTAAETVNVDLTAAGLTNAASYKLIQVQDPLVDVVTFTYTTGEALAVDMRAASHSVAVPFAHTATIDATTFPLFGAFVIEAA